jgi:hypothetical protein
MPGHVQDAIRGAAPEALGGLITAGLLYSQVYARRDWPKPYVTLALAAWVFLLSLVEFGPRPLKLVLEFAISAGLLLRYYWRPILHRTYIWEDWDFRGEFAPDVDASTLRGMIEKAFAGVSRGEGVSLQRRLPRTTPPILWRRLPPARSTPTLTGTTLRAT